MGANMNNMNNMPVNNNQNLNHGTVAIEQSRAVTEAQGKLLLAKQFPRDENEAYSKLMRSCSRPSMAAVATYSFPRGGQTVSGPSIRLAEEIARAYGNIEYGIRELSSANGESEMEAYAWDLQTNTVSSQKFKVKHVRDKRGGGQALTDQRDIYELTANMGARRLRSRLLAVLPPDLVEDAVEACKLTLQGGNGQPIEDRIRKMIVAFEKLSVTREMIESRIGYDVGNMDGEMIAEMMGIYNSIKQGQSKRDEWFDVPKPALEKPTISTTGSFEMEQSKPVEQAQKVESDFDKKAAIQWLVKTKKAVHSSLIEGAKELIPQGDDLTACCELINALEKEVTEATKLVDSKESAEKAKALIDAMKVKGEEAIKVSSGGVF